MVVCWVVRGDPFSTLKNARSLLAITMTMMYEMTNGKAILSANFAVAALGPKKKSRPPAWTREQPASKGLAGCKEGHRSTNVYLGS